MKDPDSRYKDLNGEERGLYWKAIRLGYTPTQAVIYAIEEAFKIDRKPLTP